MKFFKFGVYVAWIACIACLSGAIAADPAIEAPEEEVVALEPSEADLEPEAALESADAATENLPRAEDSVNLDLVFGPSLATLESGLDRAGENDLFTPKTGWYKICVPNTCLPCSTNADCPGSDTCHAVRCP